jgi:hypothetical protein
LTRGFVSGTWYLMTSPSAYYAKGPSMTIGGPIFFGPRRMVMRSRLRNAAALDTGAKRDVQLYL